MPPARLICCEKTGRWAVAFRRELGGKHRVYETRSLADCLTELAASPASWVVLEATEVNVDSLAMRLTELRRRFPLARAMVCGERAVSPHEWLLREAGAVHAVFSPRDLAPSARMAVRHLAAAPEPAGTLRERIWARLPWGE